MSNEVKYGIQTKSLLLIGCLFNMYQQEFIVKDIGFVLLIIISSLLISYQPTIILKILLLIGTIILAVFFAKYALFFPVLLYDLLEEKRLFTYILFPFIGGVLIVVSFYNELSMILLYVVLGAMAIFMKQKVDRLLILEANYNRLEQSSHEQQFLLEKQNFNLIEEQNLNLTLGISEERNRIARDIHDNVGHLLSSSLIQIGALRVLNHEQLLEEPMKLLEETVQEGMENIRQSVHNLHDDSLNLKQSLTYIVDSFHECPIELHYAIKGELSTTLKMDFLMIVREALANIMKHSNCTKVSLEVVEQPAFYRVLVKDNGTKQETKSPTEIGMGLNSMSERIVKQGGRLTTEQQLDGFQVLAIVPKNGEGEF